MELILTSLYLYLCGVWCITKAIQSYNWTTLDWDEKLTIILWPLLPVLFPASSLVCYLERKVKQWRKKDEM